MSTVFTHIPSPFGKVLVAWDDRGLVRVGIGDLEGQAERAWRFDPALDCDATRQLREYFAGERREFDLPMVLEGAPFQMKVWRALERIPFGKTMTYGEIGKRLGSPNSARAVGMSCATNPLPIVIPCHRVVGSNGKLVGFGGGLDMKRGLLEFERGQSSLALGVARKNRRNDEACR
jgi:methylated-DNA-[protein]-cysteine S-methyltransferase